MSSEFEAAQKTRDVFGTGALRQALEKSPEAFDPAIINFVMKAVHARLKRFEKRGTYVKGVAP